MKLNIIILALPLALASLDTSAQVTTYSYTGPNYTSTQIQNFTATTCDPNANCANYTISMNMTASITLSSPLPANFSGPLNSSSSPALLWYNVNDGLVNYSTYNSAPTISVTTDASGNILNSQTVISASSWQPQSRTPDLTSSTIISQPFYDYIAPISQGSSYAQHANNCTLNVATDRCTTNTWTTVSSTSQVNIPTNSGVWSIIGGQPLTILSGFHQLDHRPQSSLLEPAGDYVTYGLYVSPYTGTTINISNPIGSGTLPVPYSNDTGSAIYQFGSTVPFNAAYTPALTYTISNPSSPSSINHTDIPALSDTNHAAPPYITGAATSDLSLTPTITWSQSATYTPPQGVFWVTRVQIWQYDPVLHWQKIYQKNISNSSTSFAVPSNILAYDRQYILELDNSLYSLSDATNPIYMYRGYGTQVETTRSYVNFSPSTQSLNFSGPIQLPTTDNSGNFTFSLSQLPTAGTPVLLDPPVDVGFTYTIGQGNPNFASATFPNIGNFTYNVSIWNGSGYVSYQTGVAPNQTVTFPNAGVSSFQVSGIPVGTALIPTNVTAFEASVTFTQSGNGQFTGTITPIQQNVNTPSAPLSVGSSLASSNSLTIGWTTPSNNGGIAITGYDVQISTNGGNTWLSPTNTGDSCYGSQAHFSTANSCTVSGLTAGQIYIVEVAAINAVGTGSYGIASNSTTIPNPQTAVNGQCGSAAGVAIAFAPTINLCSAGTLSGSVSAIGSNWSWQCQGINGGINSVCVAPKQLTGTGSGSGSITISNTNGWSIDGTKSKGFAPISNYTANTPAGYSFPQGMVDFSLTGGTPGSTATITINFPTAIPANAVIWKYNRNTQQWLQYNQFSISGSTLNLTVTDGSSGDEDGVADGNIVDPVTYGIPSDSTSGIPTLNEWGQLILGSLLAVGGLAFIRRRPTTRMI